MRSTAPSNNGTFGGILMASVGQLLQLCITVFAALNLDFGEWGEAFPNKLLGASTLDRIRHGAYQLVLDGKSYRAPRPETKRAKTSVEKRAKTAL